jgi:hypothetical protein
MLMPTRWEQFQDEAGKTAFVVGLIALHTVICGVIIFCMWTMQHLILLLWGGQEPVLADVPLHTIILGGELAVLLAFLIIAVISTTMVLWR